MKPGDVLELTIHDLAFGGDGVARHESGRVVFVRWTITGERVRARIVRVKSGHAFAALEEVLEPSPEREEPPCPYFGACGGCAYQHMTYTAELAAKQKQLEDALRRIGGLENPVIRPVIASPQPYGYRNRISVHSEGRATGFRAVDGVTLVDVERCLLASDGVNEKLGRLRRSGAGRPHVSLRDDDVATTGFVQTNRHLGSVLLDTVAAEMDPACDGWVEGYGGDGFFTRLLAARGGPVVMVEQNAAAAERARRGLPGVRVLDGDCAEMLSSAAALLECSRPGCFIDPPREGADARVLDHINQHPYTQLLYVSCNPATLARDARALGAGWKPVMFQPLDMFPRTTHIECLAHFQRA